MNRTATIILSAMLFLGITGLHVMVWGATHGWFTSTFSILIAIFWFVVGLIVLILLPIAVFSGFTEEYEEEEV